MKAITTSDKFYQHLGRAFYAIAFADGKVREQEFERLKQLIRKEWVGADSPVDEFGTNLAYKVEFVFDWLREQGVAAESSMNAFAVFYAENKNLFTDVLRDKTWKTATAIASAYAGRNKAELIMLDRLRGVLKS